MGTEINRKLASIQRIVDIKPIPGADAIEVVTVLGWQVVTRKNEFKVGDLVVYIEIDSWVPHTIAPFLSKGQSPRIYRDVSGEKLKTIRLRKQLSQGLILPLSVIQNTDSMPLIFTEGDDVTETLSIIKWEMEIAAHLQGKVRGNFPSWIPKTDQERVQNFWNKLPKDITWEVSIKLDGSSCTVYKKDGYLGVCSRNMDLTETPDNAYWKAIRAQDIEKKLESQDNIALQGELFGMGVQGNNEQMSGAEFRVFDIYNIGTQSYFTPEERQLLCADLNIAHVPILEKAKSLTDFATLQDALAYAEGSSLNPKVQREGVVFKANGQSDIASFKIISNKYLEGKG